MLPLIAKRSFVYVILHALCVSVCVCAHVRSIVQMLEHIFTYIYIYNIGIHVHSYVPIFIIV